MKENELPTTLIQKGIANLKSKIKANSQKVDIPYIFSIQNIEKLPSRSILIEDPKYEKQSNGYQTNENERNLYVLRQDGINKLKESITKPSIINDHSIKRGVIYNFNKKLLSKANIPFIFSCPFNFKLKRIFIPYYFEQKKILKINELRNEERKNRLKEKEIAIEIKKQLDTKRKEIVNQIKNEKKSRLEKFKNEIKEKNHQIITQFCKEIIANIILNLNLSEGNNDNEEVSEIIISEKESSKIEEKINEENIDSNLSLSLKNNNKTDKKIQEKNLINEELEEEKSQYKEEAKLNILTLNANMNFNRNNSQLNSIHTDYRKDLKEKIKFKTNKLKNVSNDSIMFKKKNLNLMLVNTGNIKINSAFSNAKKILLKSHCSDLNFRKENNNLLKTQIPFENNMNYENKSVAKLKDTYPNHQSEKYNKFGESNIESNTETINLLPNSSKKKIKFKGTKKMNECIKRMNTPDTNDLIVNENDDINRGLSIKSSEKMQNSKNVPEGQAIDELEEHTENNQRIDKSKKKKKNNSKIKKKYSPSKNNMAFLKMLSKQNFQKENNANMKIQQFYFSPYTTKKNKEVLRDYFRVKFQKNQEALPEINSVKTLLNINTRGTTSHQNRFIPMSMSREDFPIHKINIEDRIPINEDAENFIRKSFAFENRDFDDF